MEPVAAELRRKRIPITIDFVICAVVIVRSNVHGADADRLFLHGGGIHAEPLHIVPRNKEFDRIAETVARVDFAALQFGCGIRHDGVRRLYVDPRTDVARSFFERNRARRLEVDLVHVVVRHARNALRREIHLNSAVNVTCAVGVDVDGRVFGYVVDEIHALFAEVARHGKINGVRTVLIVQIHPFTVFINFLVRFAVDFEPFVGLRIHAVGVVVTVILIRRHFGNIFRRLAGCEQRRHRKYRKQRYDCGFSFSVHTLPPYLPNTLISEMPTLFCPSGRSIVTRTDFTLSSSNSAYTHEPGVT